ncbi:MAG: polysaccharide biosynthesis C-terminal domain-containing protein, partial [Victivallaceae bacterium]
MTELFYAVPTIIGVTLFPAIVRFHANDFSGYQSRMRLFYCGMFYAGLFSVLVLNLLAPWVIDFLYGGKYNQAVEIFHIYSWNIPFFFIATVNAKVMILERCQHYQLIFSLLGVGINLTLNMVLIPQYAALGAATASIITGGVIFILLPICFRATRNIGRNILAAPNFMPAIRLLMHRFK